MPSAPADSPFAGHPVRFLDARRAGAWRALAVRAVDGDTVVVAADLGVELTATLHLRLDGYNAPERGRPGGALWTARLASLLLTHGPYALVETYRTPTTDTDVKTFERYVARLTLCPIGNDGRPLDRVSVNDAMIALGTTA